MIKGVSGGIGYVMPCMRPDSALEVIKDLCEQTTPIDYLLVVDNGGDFQIDFPTPFQTDVWKPGKNIGTNRVWNLIHDKYLFYHDYLGIIGDDYYCRPDMVETFVRELDINCGGGRPGIVTARIFKVPTEQFTRETLSKINCSRGRRKVKGKGALGAILMKRKMIEMLPPIPQEFNIFFGDNWIGYWVYRFGLKIIEVQTPILHDSEKKDLKERCQYTKVISEERVLWKKWYRGEIELGGLKISD